MVWPFGKKKQDEELLEDWEDLQQAKADDDDAPNLTLEEVKQVLGLF